MADEQNTSNTGDKKLSLGGGKGTYKEDDPNRKTSIQSSDDDQSDSSGSSRRQREGAPSRGGVMSYFNREALIEDKVDYFNAQLQVLTAEIAQLRAVAASAENDFDSIQRELRRKASSNRLLATSTRRAKNLRTKITNLLGRLNQTDQALGRLNLEISAEASRVVNDSVQYYGTLGQLQGQVRRLARTSLMLSSRLTNLLSEVNKISSPSGVASSAASKLVKKNLRRAAFAAIKSVLLPAAPFILVGCVVIMIGVLIFNSARNVSWDTVEIAWACFREGFPGTADGLAECTNEVLDTNFKERVMVGDPADPNEAGGYINPNQEVS